MADEYRFNFSDLEKLDVKSVSGIEYEPLKTDKNFFSNGDATLKDIDFTTDYGLGINNNFSISERELIKNNAFLSEAERKSQLAAFDAADQRKRLRRYSKKRRGGVLRYPLEALTEQTDYLQIDIEEYVALGNYISQPGSSDRYVRGNVFGSDRAGRRSSNRLSKKPLINNGTILLPIPSNVQDTNNVQYDDSTINGLTATAVSPSKVSGRVVAIDKNSSPTLYLIVHNFPNCVSEDTSRSDTADFSFVSQLTILVPL